MASSSRKPRKERNGQKDGRGDAWVRKRIYLYDQASKTPIVSRKLLELELGLKTKLGRMKKRKSDSERKKKLDCGRRRKKLEKQKGEREKRC
jgi:hypothetical protein